MRINRPTMFLDMAEVAARRATCYRGNVGALIVRNNDIISMGYNGPAPGEAHCRGEICPLDENGGCLRSFHAEENAIGRAISKTMRSDLDGYHLYCTSSPCGPCAERIVRSKIAAVFYRHPYRDPTGLVLLAASSHLRISRVLPSGVIIDYRSGKIMPEQAL